MSETKGQKLVRIPEKDHYFYDEKSMMIYWVKKNLNKVDKVSSGVKLDLEDKAGSLLKASREIPIKLKEREERRQKKANKKKPKLNTLLSKYLDDMIDKNSHFHKSKTVRVSEETLESYRTSVSHLRPFFENMLPSDLVPEPDQDPEDFEDPWLDFIDEFTAKNPGMGLFNITKHFRAICKYMHDNGIIYRRPKIFNPNAKKEKVIRRKKTKRTYTPEEIMLMDAVCSDDQRLALWFGFDMAFRQDDCIELTWDRIFDLDTKNPYIDFDGDDNKAGLVGRVPISDSVAELLRERKATSKSNWVFPLVTDPEHHIITQAFKFEEVVRGSGVNYGSHKILRHTRLTEDFGNAQLDNTLVMKIRRVSLAVALEHYIHPTEGDFEKFRNTSKTKRRA